MRRANFMVSGVRLEGTRKHVLRLGGVRSLTAALDPHGRGGVYGVVLDDGEVSVGDTVSMEPAADRQER